MEKAVIALGGNAISSSGRDDIHVQFANTRKSLEGIVDLIRDGYHLALTHGNGPQVGNALLRVEKTAQEIPPLPLGVIVADTEGSMGYMIEQSLQNQLLHLGIARQVVTVITQVVVDPDDPSIINPTKFIGPFYTEKQARQLAQAFGWTVKEDSNRGFRRVVPSPIPRRIVNRQVIQHLVDEGIIVIAAGGGGIPVYVEVDGTFEGVDAVIDKDRASAVLAHDIAARTLVILTGVDRVCIDFGKPGEQPIDRCTIAQAREWLSQGQFPSGSMGPKVEAAVSFLEQGGSKVIITSLDQARDAIAGRAGTHIVK